MLKERNMKTKIYYLFLFIMFFLMSCERTNNVSESRVIGSSGSTPIYEYTMNGHDYIKRGYGMAHSGTCKKCKQERDSIVNVIIKEIKNGKE